MDRELYQNHLELLKEELVVALGCTEPIAIAYAAARARQVLGEMPEHCTVCLLYTSQSTRHKRQNAMRKSA